MGIVYPGSNTRSLIVNGVNLDNLEDNTQVNIEIADTPKAHVKEHIKVTKISSKPSDIEPIHGNADISHKSSGEGSGTKPDKKFFQFT